MTENRSGSSESPWLSTKHPPKQNPKVKQSHVTQRPLSRKLPPLKMMSSHGNSLSRFTQNSPPPVQLKLARKQSTMMDYFDSAGSGINTSKPLNGRSLKQSILHCCEVKETNETSTLNENEKQQDPASLDNSRCRSPLKRSPCEQLDSAELVFNNRAVCTLQSDETLDMPHQQKYDNDVSKIFSYVDNKKSPMKISHQLSPLKEIQLSCIKDLDSNFSEKASDNQGKICSSSYIVSQSSPRRKRVKLSPNSTVQLEALSFATVGDSSYFQSNSTGLSSKDVSLKNLNISHNSRQTWCQKTNNILEERKDLNKSYNSNNRFFNEETLSLDLLHTDSKSYIEPNFSNKISSDENTCIASQREPIEASRSTLFNNTYSQYKPIDSLESKGSKPMKKRQRDGSEEVQTVSDMFVLAESESHNLETEQTICLRLQNTDCDQTSSSREEILNTDTFDLNSQLSDHSKNNAAFISVDPEAKDLNLSSESQTPSFTAESQTLQFSDDFSLGQSGEIIYPRDSSIDEIMRNKADQLRYLKTKKLAEMGSLSFTQTNQSFCM